MRIGIIARADNTGLGYQTQELCNMLNPHKVMIINFSMYNKNEQHYERYQNFNSFVVKGIPTTNVIRQFLQDLDVVISCETFYNDDLVILAKRLGVKTVLQYNYELFGNLQNKNAPIPDMFLAPSLWNFEDVVERFKDKTKVDHLPPPTSPETFKNSRLNNLSKRHNRILHIAGKKAAWDRNGTDTVLAMLKYSTADYELVIKAQHGYDLKCDDPRVKIEYNNPKNREDMYDGFDAMVLPRRYAGLCLPMNEALISGLPVFMTDISPNNIILPKEWLVLANKIGTFQAKTDVDIYEADTKELASLIDNYINTNNIDDFKSKALSIGSQFYPENLKDKYLEIFK